MSQAVIGGYRMMRRLGEGARATVMLAHPEHGRETEPVAVKTYRDCVPQQHVLREAAMLSRGAGAHVVRLLDVASAADGRTALVLERVGGGSVARLLARRELLAPGEAITLLAPVAQAVLRLHECGVVHGALSAETVHLDAVGAPVLLGFGDAQAIDPGLSPAALAAETAAAEDVHRLREFAEQVLSRVPDSPAVRELCSPWHPEVDLHEQLRRWVERLFDLAEPLPIRATESHGLADAPLLSRLPTREPLAEPAEPARLAVGLPEWLDEPVQSAAKLARRWLGVLRLRFGAVRARAWVPALLVGLALVAALVFAPDSAPDATGPTAEPTSEPSVPAAIPVAAVPDDPVLAAAALLAQRERCLRELSVLCLDAVGQVGSAALAEDQRLVRELQAGAELPEDWVVEASGFTLIERLGDSALISLGDVPETQPASLLLMQGEAGWRIRGYLQQ